jgi:hypothetical protein
VEEERTFFSHVLIEPKSNYTHRLCVSKNSSVADSNFRKKNSPEFPVPPKYFSALLRKLETFDFAGV